VIESGILRRLEERGVGCCLIGAAALSVHGFARYSADVDLLVCDRRVLASDFWIDCGDPEIRLGGDEDPLLGVVRWDRPAAIDIVVNDDYASRHALSTAAPAPDVPAKVATPVALVLLKLEAGGTLDARDVVALIEVQRALNGAPWLDELAAEIPRLRSPARALWSRLAAELGIPSPWRA
jgi:hypothetical protein